MTPQETIIVSGLSLRAILALNPDALSVTLERPDGTWAYARSEGLEYLAPSGRTLKVPEAVFDAAEAEAWEPVDCG